MFAFSAAPTILHKNRQFLFPTYIYRHMFTRQVQAALPFFTNRCMREGHWSLVALPSLQYLKMSSATQTQNAEFTWQTSITDKNANGKVWLWARFQALHVCPLFARNLETDQSKPAWLAIRRFDLSWLCSALQCYLKGCSHFNTTTVSAKLTSFSGL